VLSTLVVVKAGHTWDSIYALKAYDTCPLPDCEGWIDEAMHEPDIGTKDVRVRLRCSNKHVIDLTITMSDILRDRSPRGVPP
jgi:hypothetical protein